MNNCRSFSLFSKFPENNNSNWKGCEDLWEASESGGGGKPGIATLLKVIALYTPRRTDPVITLNGFY